MAETREEPDYVEYERGDGKVVEVGHIQLKDGRTFPHGMVLVFPRGAPPLPISVVWEGTPVTLSVKKAKE